MDMAGNRSPGAADRSGTDYCFPTQGVTGLKPVACVIPTLLLVCASLAIASPAEAKTSVPNPGFEIDSDSDGVPDHWQVSIGGAAKAEVTVDSVTVHSGSCAAHISNASSLQPFVFASIASEEISVTPSTTYAVHFYAKGQGARNCHFGVAFEGGGDHRLYLEEGDYDWREFVCRFTTPEKAAWIHIRFASDDVTDGFWIDDVTIEKPRLQSANLKERRYPKDFPGVFPRSAGPLEKNLLVFDCRQQPNDMEMALAALQGIVNRSAPRLYIINKTNPPDYDELWLDYMQEKGYTAKEQRVAGPSSLVQRFREEITGAIVYDEDLPGSVHAACMLAGVKRALPFSPRMAKQFDLPVLMDLRGKWQRNVDAYRYVFEHYWDRMNHHVLAWHHPLTEVQHVRDYLVEFNVFTFWMSKYGDRLKGADPAAEEQFIHQLFASTPANIPVMGWPAYADSNGIPEYTGVRWCSEYGKFVPGTEFCSNLSIHTAVHPPDRVFTPKQSPPQSPVHLQRDKTYITINLLDSGDGLWYWQFHQRKVWADPQRGSVPIGWCTNITLYDTLPLVLEWYYENATANDSFFAAVSGLGYMNTPAYASRFRPEDRERIWNEYIHLTDEYCRKLGISGIELYNGGWGEQTPPATGVFRRFTRGMKDLQYILADLGRHNNINPSNANHIIDDVPVFHTLTRFRLWTSSGDVDKRDRDDCIGWLADEIKGNAPQARPGFMSAMAISWNFFPSWIRETTQRLPDSYVVVPPSVLADLYKEWQHTEQAETPHRWENRDPE